MSANPSGQPYAVLCAGQGAQAVGMGRDLAGALPEVQALYARANTVLGYDLARLCFEGPDADLVQSQHCQPAIYVTTVACCRAWRLQAGVGEPTAFAGLSLGEWTALHLAGVVTFEDGLRILAARGRFMQDACEERPGAMLSVIGLTPEQLQPVAAAVGVELANLNSPEQTVLSGERARIEAAEPAVLKAGAKKAVRLNVAGAYHSSLMASAARRLEEWLQDVTFQPPRVPVISNVTGRPHGAPDEIRSLMVRQVTSSVRWVDSVQTLRQAGSVRYLECGPGRVLSGLVKRIQPDAVLANVQDLPSLEKTRAAWSA